MFGFNSAAHLRRIREQRRADYFDYPQDARCRPKQLVWDVAAWKWVPNTCGHCARCRAERKD